MSLCLCITVDDAQLVDANDVMDAGPAAPASADSAVLVAEAPAVGTDDTDADDEPKDAPVVADDVPAGADTLLAAEAPTEEALEPDALAEQEDVPITAAPAAVGSADGPYDAPAVVHDTLAPDAPMMCAAVTTEPPVGGEAYIDSGGRPDWLVVGARVRLRGEVSGIVAEITPLQGDLTIATDDCTWETVRADLISISVQQCTLPVTIGVQALSYDHASKLAGMLVGETSERSVIPGMNSYMAHYAKPVVRDYRLKTRSTDQRPSVQSFALGDVVEQIATSPTSGERWRASVVRVLHKPKVGSSQSKRLLILCEMLPVGRLCRRGDPPPEFFPASITNWTRVAAHGGPWAEHEDADSPMAACLRLTEAEFKAQDEVCVPTAAYVLLSCRLTC